MPCLTDTTVPKGCYATTKRSATIYGTTHAIMGEYRDTFRRVDGKWLFAERIFTMFASASSL